MWPALILWVEVLNAAQGRKQISAPLLGLLRYHPVEVLRPTMTAGWDGNPYRLSALAKEWGCHFSCCVWLKLGSCYLTVLCLAGLPPLCPGLEAAGFPWGLLFSVPIDISRLAACPVRVWVPWGQKKTGELALTLFLGARVPQLVCLCSPSLRNFLCLFHKWYSGCFVALSGRRWGKCVYFIKSESD